LPDQDTLQGPSIALLSATILTFFSSVLSNPKNLAISIIWLGLTKSAGSAQNFSMHGANSRQRIVFGMFMPMRHEPEE
jgi:hypothetical protein